ncbi:hypothetical protein AYI70_g7242 [Smittium culicis]|uniref:Uncharacterized protein n=1 Tax=Smittium culicis TaxID=133412 RepID=A0A1R1XLK3_9FUNG|nr:hypothetical protein AYI70_g7242 [Smittium culicis]
MEILIPSMSGYFYRMILADENKKKGNYGCPLSKKVCYSPPTIKEAAPDSVKKVGASFKSKTDQEDPVVDVLNMIRWIIGNSASMVERTSDSLNRSLSGRAPFGVKKGLRKAHEQSVVPEYCGEGAPNTFQEIGTDQQGLRGEPIKYFCRAGLSKRPCSTKRIYRFYEKFYASLKSDADGAATINMISLVIQADAQSRGPLDPDNIGGVPPYERCYRRGRESDPRILQQFIMHPKEDWRATSSIESMEAKPEPRGKEIQD